MNERSTWQRLRGRFQAERIKFAHQRDRGRIGNGSFSSGKEGTSWHTGLPFQQLCEGLYVVGQSGEISPLDLKRIGNGEGDLLHLAVEGEGGRRRITVERCDGQSFVFDAFFDGRRHDFFLSVPPGEGPLRMTLSGDEAAEIIEARLVKEDADAYLSHYDEQHICGSITRANWRGVQAQETEAAEWCWAWPECLQLELTKACNYQCPHCGTHGTSEVHRRNNAQPPMDEALLEKIATEMFPFLRRTSLVGVGEPFVAPASLLDRLVHHLERTATRLEASTNGALLDEAMIEKLLPVLGHLTFSIDAATEETYGRVRASKSFKKVISAFQRLSRARDQATPSKHFDLSTVFTLMRSNASELCDFLRLSSEWGADGVYVRHLLVHFPAFQEETLIRDPKAANPLIEKAAKEADRLGLTVFLPDLIGQDASEQGDAKDVPSSSGTKRERSRVQCAFLWRTIVILADGSIYPCGGLSPPLLGNIKETSFADIWNGGLLREMRRRLNTDDPHPTCAHCWYREISYFDSPAVQDDFLRRGTQAPKEKKYDASAFIARPQ